jgi:hypothetical protein
MDDPSLLPAPSRWPWILWGLTTLALLAVGILTDCLAQMAQTFYLKLEFKTIPGATELILKYRDTLPRWLLPLAIAGSGIPFAYRGDTERTQRWSIVILLVLLILGAAFLYALLLPLIPIQFHRMGPRR